MEQLALDHLSLHHSDADGWITLARKQDGRFRQHHYKLNEMEEVLPDWLGDDLYFSQNTFFTWKRRIEHLRQLRALYVDIDCYKLGYTPEWVYGKVELELFGEAVPNPNYVIYSGRGLVMVWLIESVSDFALPLWQAVESHFYKQFEYVGADPLATDAARIFRLAGSTNSKSGNVVEIDVRHHYRYDLRDLQFDYLPELKPKHTSVKKNKEAGQRTTDKAVDNVKNLYSTRTLHYARIKDLVKLVELRSYNVVDFRETICFLYRYWSCCFLADPDKALEDTLSFNNEFIDPLSETEIIHATKSAEKAWESKSNETVNKAVIDKGYKSGAGYNFTNAKLIEMLKITVEEQQHLKTIIGRNEKYRRNNDRRAIQRKSEGKQTMDEYQETRKMAAVDKLKDLQRLINNHPNTSNYGLAELLEVSESYVRKLRKQLP